MSEYILIMVFSGSFGGASSVAEFGNLKACEKAAEVVRKYAPASDIMARCFPKSEVPKSTQVDVKVLGKIK